VYFIVGTPKKIQKKLII